MIIEPLSGLSVIDVDIHKLRFMNEDTGIDYTLDVIFSNTNLKLFSHSRTVYNKYIKETEFYKYGGVKYLYETNKLALKLIMPKGIKVIIGIKDNIDVFKIQLTDPKELNFDNILDLSPSDKSFSNEELQIHLATQNSHSLIVADNIIQFKRNSTISRDIFNIFSNKNMKKGNIIGNFLMTEDFSLYYLGSFYEVTQ